MERVDKHLLQKNQRRNFVFIVLILLASIFSFMQYTDIQARERPGKWAEVCCGKACGIDYCLGNGSYTCCK